MLKACLSYGTAFLGDPTGISGAAAGTAFDAACTSLDRSGQAALEQAMARAETTLAALIGEGVAADDRDRIISNAQLIICHHGPSLSSAPAHGNDPRRMAEAALAAAGTAQALGIEARHWTHVTRLVHGFYEAILADKAVLADISRHVDRFLLKVLEDQAKALAGVPHEVHGALIRASAGALLHLPRPAAELKTPSALLRADNAVVPFTGRDAEMADLLGWCSEGEDRVRVRLYVGQGGQGKTRLLLELAKRLARSHRGQAWRAGLLREREMREAPEEAVRRLVTGGNVLVIVDYAETRRDDITRLLQAAEEAEGGRLRLVLLARAAGDWWDALLRMSGRARDLLELETTDRIDLRPLAEDVADKATLLAESAQAFAEARGAAVPNTAALASLPGLATALELQIAALLAVLGDAPTEAGTRLLRRLLDREQEQWEEMLPGAGIPDARAMLPGMRQAMAAITLLGGVRGQEAGHAVLALSPSLADVPRHQKDVLLRVLADLYGPSFREPHSPAIGPMEPDRVGEVLVDGELVADGALLDRLCDSVILPAIMAGDRKPAERALTVLTRLAQRLPGAAQWLNRAFADDARALALTPAAITVAQETGDPIGQRLAPALERAAKSERWRAEVAALHVPYPTTTLRELAVMVTEAQLAATATGDDEEARAERAGRLNDLSIHLADLGRREDALAAIEEATALYRTLAQDRPDAFTPNLAGSLNNLSGCLTDLGQREAALASIEEATALYRTLARDRPDAFTPDLAVSLNTLSNRLADLGRREDALASIEEAVALYRTLAQARPDAFIPNLAGSLNNLSLRLADLGRREDALAAIEEVVALYRTLAQARPDAFTPNLAGSLNNLSGCLTDLGQREDALASIEEAVALYRTLAQARPDAFIPNLAGSLNNLSLRLADLGRREDALASIEEAVALYRTLARDRPDAFTPDLARSLGNLSNCLGALGRREAALAAVEEAVALRRTLAQARPDAFTPDLAVSLNTLSNRLADLGRREDALAAIEEVVALYRTLAQARPDAFTPNLSSSLNNLSLRLADLGRREDALAAIEEVVALGRTLAQARPDAFTPDLATSLGARGAALHQSDSVAAAASFREGVVTLEGIFRRYPAALAPLMRALVTNYRAACKAAGIAPDEASLAPIEAALARLPPAP